MYVLCVFASTFSVFNFICLICLRDSSPSPWSYRNNVALQRKLTLSSISLALHPSLPFHLAFIPPNLPLSLSLSFPFISTIPTHSFPLSFPGSGTHTWSHMCILNSPILSPLNPLNLYFFFSFHTPVPLEIIWPQQMGHYIPGALHWPQEDLDTAHTKHAHTYTNAHTHICDEQPMAQSLHQQFCAQHFLFFFSSLSRKTICHVLPVSLR